MIIFSVSSKMWLLMYLLHMNKLAYLQYKD